MVDAAFGEVMVTCEKISWLIREGERYLKPEKRSPGVMVMFSCGWHDFQIKDIFAPLRALLPFKLGPLNMFAALPDCMLCHL